MIIMIKNFLRVILTSGILDGEVEIESGGPQCENYMSYDYRLFITAIMIPIYIILYNKLSKEINLEIEKQKIQEKNPNFIELFFGYLSIFTFFLHCFYKSLSGQLMFIFNPCHMINLVEAYLLINRNNTFSKKIYIALMNVLFSPWIAILFPVTLGLNSFLEKEMFWVEHYLTALINPLILSFSSRYYSENTINLKNHMMAHSLFGLYQRVVLLPMGYLTKINLNYILCPSEVDPFVSTIGKHYYYLSDYYIFIGGEIFHRMIKLILIFLKKITDRSKVIGLKPE